MFNDWSKKRPPTEPNPYAHIEYYRIRLIFRTFCIDTVAVAIESHLPNSLTLCKHHVCVCVSRDEEWVVWSPSRNQRLGKNIYNLLTTAHKRTDFRRTINFSCIFNDGEIFHFFSKAHFRFLHRTHIYFMINRLLGNLLIWIFRQPFAHIAQTHTIVSLFRNNDIFEHQRTRWKGFTQCDTNFRFRKSVFVHTWTIGQLKKTRFQVK